MTIFNRLRARRMRPRHAMRLLTSSAMAAVCLSLSCAQPVPNQGNNALSGRRIHVVMQFNSPPEQNFYYFFLINKYGPTGTTGAYGPVPVIGPISGTLNGYGNGFATSSNQNTTGLIPGLPDYGITDFVLYHAGQSQGNIDLYHFVNSATTNVNTEPVLSIPNIPIRPLNPLLPENASASDDAAMRTIQFDVDMAQLFPNPNGQAAIAAGKLVHYLQVNIVATNVTPIDPTSNVNKEVDAMGDTLVRQNAFLEIDLSAARTYSSGDNTSSLAEPTGDVFPPGGNATSSLDLVSWTIDVQPGRDRPARIGQTAATRP